ncbi:MAG: hypothetical protein JXA93_25525 [Anaerolineae bacterium]|nr:hypothetical protein [Anaerolineae bacterium]
MAEWIHEPIVVEAQPRPGRAPRPVAFFWRGGRYVVSAWGREGLETYSDETFYCYLIQTEGPETWQICRREEQGTWIVRRRWPRRPVAA